MLNLYCLNINWIRVFLRENLKINHVIGKVYESEKILDKLREIKFLWFSRKGARNKLQYSKRQSNRDDWQLIEVLHKFVDKFEYKLNILLDRMRLTHILLLSVYSRSVTWVIESGYTTILRSKTSTQAQTNPHSTQSS